MEEDAARIMGVRRRRGGRRLRGRAASRRDLINRLLWDDAAGL
jgi:hypothetical protein